MSDEKPDDQAPAVGPEDPENPDALPESPRFENERVFIVTVGEKEGRRTARVESAEFTNIEIIEAAAALVRMALTTLEKAGMPPGETLTGILAQATAPWGGFEIEPDEGAKPLIILPRGRG